MSIFFPQFCLFRIMLSHSSMFSPHNSSSIHKFLFSPTILSVPQFHFSHKSPPLPGLYSFSQFSISPRIIFSLIIPYFFLQFSVSPTSLCSFPQFFIYLKILCFPHFFISPTIVYSFPLFSLSHIILSLSHNFVFFPTTLLSYNSSCTPQLFLSHSSLPLPEFSILFQNSPSLSQFSILSHNFLFSI